MLPPVILPRKGQIPSRYPGRRPGRRSGFLQVREGLRPDRRPGLRLDSVVEFCLNAHASHMHMHGAYAAIG